MLFIGAGRLFVLRCGGRTEASLVVKRLIFALFISKRQQAVFREQEEHGGIFQRQSSFIKCSGRLTALDLCSNTLNLSLIDLDNEPEVERFKKTKKGRKK